MKRIVIAVGLMTTLLLSPAWSTLAHALTDIPNLPQVQRSDWLNVKTQKPAAVGDGIADDTAAIQAALDKLGNLGPDESHVSANRKYTVYLPAGTYKITQPLQISDIGRAYQSMMGIQLVGDGALTRLVWGGAAEPDKAMIVSNGAGEATCVTRPSNVAAWRRTAGDSLRSAFAATATARATRCWLSFRRA